MAKFMVSNLVFWSNTLLMILSWIDFIDSQRLYDKAQKCSGQEEIDFLKEELSQWQKMVKDQAIKLENVEEKLHFLDKKLSVCCSSTDSSSNGEGNKGKEFLILFMRNYQSAKGPVIIYITTDNITSVNISTSAQLNTNIKSATDRMMNISSVSKVTLPFDLSCNYLIIEPKAVLVQTSELSTVSIFDSFYTGSTDGTVIIPTNKLSKKYLISSSNPHSILQEYYSQFAIAAIYDRTSVTVRFKMRNNTSISLLGRTYRNQDFFSTILEKYETLQINHITDLSGTSVTSTEPIAVFSGNRCQELADFGCSHMVTQLPPNIELDNQYIVPPFFESGGTLVQVISGSKSFIKVTVGSNVSSWQMSEQEYKNIEVTTSKVTIVDSDKPVLVTGMTMGSSNNDPYITVIPGVNQFVDHYKVVVPEGYTKNYVSLIIQEKLTDYLQINGSSVHNYKTVYLTSTVLGATFSIRIIEVDKGPIVVLTTNKAKFGLIVYGHKYNDGYAFTCNYILS